MLLSLLFFFMLFQEFSCLFEVRAVRRSDAEELHPVIRYPGAPKSRSFAEFTLSEAKGSG